MAFVSLHTHRSVTQFHRGILGGAITGAGVAGRTATRLGGNMRRMTVSAGLFDPIANLFKGTKSTDSPSDSGNDVLKWARTAKPGCPIAPEAPADPSLQLATFAGGCFWGLELAYQRVEVGSRLQLERSHPYIHRASPKRLLATQEVPTPHPPMTKCAAGEQATLRLCRSAGGPLCGTMTSNWCTTHRCTTTPRNAAMSGCYKSFSTRYAGKPIVHALLSPNASSLTGGPNDLEPSGRRQRHAVPLCHILPLGRAAPGSRGGCG